MSPLWMFLVFAGCTPKTLPATPAQVVIMPAPPTGDGPSPVSAVLAGMGYVVLLPLDQQRAEIANYREAFERDRLPSDRLRLALILTMADPSLQDPARARELLQEAPFDADQGAYEALARLVLALITERETRVSEASASAEMLSAERARRKELEEKILGFEELERRVEALKALETGGKPK